MGCHLLGKSCSDCSSSWPFHCLLLLLLFVFVLFLMIERPHSFSSDINIHGAAVFLRSQCSKIFFSKTAWPIKAKFYVEPPWVGGTKVCSRHVGHMTKMAATQIYCKKPFKNLLLQNRWADFHETWYMYVTSGTRAHHSLFK